MLSDNRLVTIKQVGNKETRNCTVLHAQLTDAGFHEDDESEKEISCRLTKEAAFFKIDQEFYRMDFSSSFEQRDYKEHGYTSLVEIHGTEYPTYRESLMKERYGSFLHHTSTGIREVSFIYENAYDNTVYTAVTVEGHGTYLIPPRITPDFHYIGSNIINVSQDYPRVLSSDFQLHFPGVSCVRQIIGVYNEPEGSYIVATTPWDISVTWISYKENLVTAI